MITNITLFTIIPSIQLLVCKTCRYLMRLFRKPKCILWKFIFLMLLLLLIIATPYAIVLQKIKPKNKTERWAMLCQIFDIVRIHYDAFLTFKLKLCYWKVCFIKLPRIQYTTVISGHFTQSSWKKKKKSKHLNVSCIMLKTGQICFKNLPVWIPSDF